MQTLIFTIATNGYAEFMAEHIASQREYAAVHGYRHVALTKTPPWGISASSSAWLKIPMMLHYLRTACDRVLFLDADAKVTHKAPPLEAMMVPAKTVYMAREASGKFNSGVMMCLRSPTAIAFIRRIYSLADWPASWLPREDQNLYENGHVIYVSHFFDQYIQTIDPRWNYTYATVLPDPDDHFVLHGRDSWHSKPRSVQKSPSRWSTYTTRLMNGPRTFQLWRLCRWYANEYPVA